MSKNLRKLSRKADALFSKKIREAGECRRCGAKDRILLCHHIISRRYHNVRYNRSNCIAICRNCHFWIHNNPLQSEEWYEEILGKSGYEAMKKIALAAPIKIDYEELIKRLGGEL